MSIVDGARESKYGYGHGDGARHISYNLGTILVGMLVAGFGTSIYTSQNQEGMDMAVKKSMFNLLVRLLGLITKCFIFQGSILPLCSFWQYGLRYLH